MSTWVVEWITKLTQLFFDVLPLTYISNYSSQFCYLVASKKCNNLTS